MLITPEQAQKWLDENNTDNYRNLDMNLARQYSRDMFSDRWIDTKQPINFDVDDVLQDGQHRLVAIVLSKTDQEMVVNFGMPKEAREHTDIGRKRTLASILKNAGYTNSNHVQSVFRLHLDVETLRKTGKASGRFATFPEIKELADNEEDIAFAISATVKVPTKIANRTSVTYAYLMMHKINPDAAAVFLNKITDPANLPEGHPLLKMHKRFTTGSWYVKGRALRLQQVVVMFRAWNAWVNGQSTVTLSPLPADEVELKIPELSEVMVELPELTRAPEQKV